MQGTLPQLRHSLDVLLPRALDEEPRFSLKVDTVSSRCFGGFLARPLFFAGERPAVMV